MPSYDDDLIDVLNRAVEDCEAVLAGLGLTSANGGRIYDICERLRECLEGAVIVAPFRAGDRVRLRQTPVIDQKTSWGWLFAKGFLVEGALATVRAVKFDSRGFGLLLAFDGEPLEFKSLFYFSANAVSRVGED
jgi:hypothetical protein